MSSDHAIGARIRWTFGRITALVAILGGLALVVWLVITVKGVLLLAFLAVLCALALDSGVRALRALVRMPRWLALLLIWLALGALLVGGGFLLAPQVQADVADMRQRIPQALQQIDATVESTYWGRRAVDELSTLWETGTLQKTAQRFFGFFSSVLGFISAILLVLFLGTLMAGEPYTYLVGALRLLPPSARSRAADIVVEAGVTLRRWLLGRFASMAIVFVLTWIGLVFLGLPLAFLLALIAGLLSFVPTFGPLASAVPAVLVGLSSGPQQALWVALVYLIVQIVESWGLTPFIERAAVRLPPALLMVFQLVMGVLAGVLGVLMATPLLVVLLVLAGMLYMEDGLGEGVDLP